MAVEMVLNELSHQIPASNIYIARGWISTLRKTIQAATGLGIQRVLRTGRVFYEIELGPNYFIATWLHDNEVDLDERRYFYTIITKCPYLEDSESPQSDDSIEVMEFYYSGQRADGFRYAYWINALALSFLSDSQWDRDIIDNISLQSIDPNTGNLLENQTVSVIHASKPEHVFTHQNWINKQIRESIRDGNDIWHRKDELYPNLLFCDALLIQLRSLHNSHPALRQVVKRLSELDAFCRNWQQGPFNPQSLSGNPRPESQATLKQYGKERTFLCPDSKQRIFTWHLNINPGNWRLYFFPLENEKKIIIGYIGPHLPIVTEN